MGTMTTVGFPTSGLLSKWGFGDGDMLDDWLFDHGFRRPDSWEPNPEHPLPKWNHDEDPHGFRHRVLIRVVREHVLPAIEQDIEVYEISTNHNPIRARTVNGAEWDAYTASVDGVLTPEWVEVGEDVLLAIAREERAR